MVGSFVQSIVMITDASILSRYSTISFDASGNAGLIYLTLFMGLSGLGDAGQIIMARRIGENQKSLINSILQSSLLLNLFIGGIFFLIIQQIVPAMLLGYSSNLGIANEQIDFLYIRSFGFFASAIMLSLNAFFLAIGKTWIILVSTVIFAISNIILDVLLIFGTDSIPAMGVKGAALASVLAETTAILVLLVYLFFGKEKKTFALFSKIGPTFTQLKRILSVGTPLLIQGFFALATWTVFFTWIEQKGVYELTVSQNIRAVYFLAFVPIFGFGASTKTYVSQYLGLQKSESISLIIRRMQLLIVAFLLLFFHGALLYPEQLVALINPEEAYIAESASILRLVFGSILLFGLTTPLFQTINGSGNTRFTLFIEITSIVVYLSSAYLFLKVWNWEIYYVWLVEYVYFGTIALLSLIYIKFFNWKDKVV